MAAMVAAPGSWVIGEELSVAEVTGEVGFTAEELAEALRALSLTCPNLVARKAPAPATNTTAAATAISQPGRNGR
jgi:hypothetical protein